jgi:hypothetical protein
LIFSPPFNFGYNEATYYYEDISSVQRSHRAAMLLHRKLKHRLHKHHKHLERGNLRQLIVLEAAAPAPAPSFSTTYPARNFWLHTVLPSIKYDGTFEHGSSHHSIWHGQICKKICK